MNNKEELEALRDQLMASGLKREGTLIHNLIQETEILEDELSKMRAEKKDERDRSETRTRT